HGRIAFHFFIHGLLDRFEKGDLRRYFRFSVRFFRRRSPGYVRGFLGADFAGTTAGFADFLGTGLFFARVLTGAFTGIFAGIFAADFAGTLAATFAGFTAAASMVSATASGTSVSFDFLSA